MTSAIPPVAPRILMLSGRRWPAAVRMARALLSRGCAVDVLCPVGHPLLLVPGLGQRLELPPWRAPAALRAVLASASGYALILPCDDIMVALLLALEPASTGAVKALLSDSLAARSSFPCLTDRYAFLSLAQSLGLAVPQTQRVERVQDLEAWFAAGPRRTVLKRDLSTGGTGVRIVDTLAQASAAWRAMARPLSLSTALGRAWINSDPMAGWQWRHGQGSAITVQQFIDGQPCNSMLCCWHGELRGLVSVAVVESNGETGHGMIVRRIDAPALTHAAGRIAQALQLTGFHGLDYMVERGSGRPYLIELNPRFTQLGHLGWADQPSLADALADALGAPTAPRANPEQVPASAELIAFFPQKSAAELAHSALHRVHHDVPIGAAALVADLMLPEWPLRRWPGRLYQRLRPARKTAAVRHQDCVM